MASNLFNNDATGILTLQLYSITRPQWYSQPATFLSTGVTRVARPPKALITVDVGYHFSFPCKRNTRRTYVPLTLLRTSCAYLAT